MAYLTNSIGAANFIELTGAVFYRQEEVEVFERAGVDGAGFRLLGERGEKFKLKSKQYFLDFAAAKAAMLIYKGYSGTIKTVIRNGVNHGDYVVLRAMEATTEPVLNPAGNADPTHTALLTVVWELLG